MNKVFLDTNIILDFLLDRKPFSEDVALILESSINESLELCVSPISITDINYIIGRSEGIKVANRKTKMLLDLVKVENVAESTVQKSSKSKFKDFEDGVQNFCAVEAQHKIIVTRNVKDFKASELSIMTPREFIVKMKSWR